MCALQEPVVDIGRNEINVLLFIIIIIIIIIIIMLVKLQD